MCTTFQTSKGPTTPPKLPREWYSYYSVILLGQEHPCATRRKIQTPPNVPPKLINYPPMQTRWVSEDLRTTSARSIAMTMKTIISAPSSGNHPWGLLSGRLRAAGTSVKTGCTGVFREPEERRPCTGSGSIQIQEQVAASSSRDLCTPANAHHFECGTYT